MLTHYWIYIHCRFRKIYFFTFNMLSPHSKWWFLLCSFHIIWRLLSFIEHLLHFHLKATSISFLLFYLYSWCSFLLLLSEYIIIILSTKVTASLLPLNYPYFIYFSLDFSNQLIPSKITAVSSLSVKLWYQFEIIHCLTEILLLSLVFIKLNSLKNL